jgi:hypothetical protein
MLAPVSRIGLSALTLIAAGTLPAHAAQYARDLYDGDWHFSLAPYIWVPGFDGNFRFHIPPGTSGSPEVHAGPADILSLLNVAFMINGDMRKNKWSLFADFVYVDLSNDKARVRTITGPGGAVEFPVNVATKTSDESTLFTLGVAYTVYHDRTSMVDVFLGTRLLESRLSLDWNFAGPVTLLPHAGSFSQKTDMWDGLIGVKGRNGFSGTHWFIDWYADVGTGESELTYQALAGVGYAFSWGDVTLNYRYLHYGGTSSKLIEDMSLPGPSLGVRFHF